MKRLLAEKKRRIRLATNISQVFDNSLLLYSFKSLTLKDDTAKRNTRRIDFGDGNRVRGKVTRHESSEGRSLRLSFIRLLRRHKRGKKIK